MKAIWSIVHSSLRGYRAVCCRQKSSWASVSGKKFQSQMFPEDADGIDENEEDDLDPDESNFATVGKLHKIHEKEMSIQRKKIKTRIIKRKYFETREPAMLTWSEKEQIRFLHAKDPKEWSIDRLSESFPASRETITKILGGKWLPKAVKVIENYDTKVKNNWKLFKAGNLAVDSKLHAHLSKFKDRNIENMDKEMMEKLIRAKPVFPNPTSVMFSNIIRSYVDDNASNKNCNQVNKMCEEPVKSLSEQCGTSTLNIKKMTSNEHCQEALTYDMFLERYVESVNVNEITQVDRVIVDENKQRNAEAYKSKSLVLESKSIVDNFKTPQVAKGKMNEISLVESVKADTFQTMNDRTINEKHIETGIIARQKKSGVTPDNYPEYIKIPGTDYKPGTMYRIEDRYYDDDGEFLYRVPGILS